MTEETYDEGRARNLEAMLRALAARILLLDRAGTLLDTPGELLKIIGDVRSELFHYEVRATYDSPEVADHRRIVAESTRSEPGQWQRTEWSPDQDEEEAE